MSEQGIIIAAKAKRDSGKTVAIRGVWMWLKDQKVQKISEEIHAYHDSKKQDDVTAVFEYQGVRIGISSWGDPDIDQEGILNEFIQAGCRVIVCACRTKLSTKEPIEALRDSWDIRYIIPADDGFIPQNDFLDELKKAIQEIKSGKKNIFSQTAKSGGLNVNYYLVGANWAGEQQNEDFYRRGYWEMGYDDSEQPTFAETRDDMKPGDRIAIKSMDGQGATTIAIHALGIVKDVFQGRVYVDWILTGLDRHVPSRGCFRTIHGPYDANDPWIHEVFCI